MAIDWEKLTKDDPFVFTARTAKGNSFSQSGDGTMILEIFLFCRSYSVTVSVKNVEPHNRVCREGSCGFSI